MFSYFLPDGRKATTPFWAGVGSPGTLCDPVDHEKHDWQNITSEETDDQGNHSQTQQCAKCRYFRAVYWGGGDDG